MFEKWQDFLKISKRLYYTNSILNMFFFCKWQHLRKFYIRLLVYWQHFHNFFKYLWNITQRTILFNSLNFSSEKYIWQYSVNKWQHFCSFIGENNPNIWFEPGMCRFVSFVCHYDKNFIISLLKNPNWQICMCLKHKRYFCLIL